MSDTEHGKACGDCVVFSKKISPCFIARSVPTAGCDESCYECEFFNEIYLPRFNIVHQFYEPAAICKGSDIWIGNQSFAELCGLSVEDLIGAGIERVVHADSLMEIMAAFKRIDLEGLGGPRAYDIGLKGNGGTVGVKVSVYPLAEPEEAVLAVAGALRWKKSSS